MDSDVVARKGGFAITDITTDQIQLRQGNTMVRLMKTSNCEGCLLRFSVMGRPSEKIQEQVTHMQICISAGYCNFKYTPFFLSTVCDRRKTEFATVAVVKMTGKGRTDYLMMVMNPDHEVVFRQVLTEKPVFGSTACGGLRIRIGETQLNVVVDESGDEPNYVVKYVDPSSKEKRAKPN